LSHLNVKYLAHNAKHKLLNSRLYKRHEDVKRGIHYLIHLRDKSCADEELNTTQMYGTDRLNMHVDKVRNMCHKVAQKYEI
jgi:hypothetical protein